MSDSLPTPKFIPTRRNYRITARDVRFCTLVHEGSPLYSAYQEAFQRPGREEISMNVASNAADRMMKRPHIREYLRTLQQQAFDAAQVNVNRIIAGLAAVAFADRRELFDAKGRMKRPGDWPAEIAAAVEAITDETTKSRMGTVKRKRTVKTGSRNIALLALARILKLYGLGSVKPGSEDQPLLIVTEADDDDQPMIGTGTP